MKIPVATCKKMFNIYKKGLIACNDKKQFFITIIS